MSAGRSRSAIEFQDIVAATFVVGNDLQVADFLSIPEAIPNLPDEGGTIFCLTELNVPSTITLPDKSVAIEFANGATITAVGLGVNPMFLIPDGLTAERQYVFILPTAVGENIVGQYFLELADTGGFGKVEMQSPNIRNFRNFIRFSAGDVTLLESSRVVIFGGMIIPAAADVTSILVSTPAAYASNAFASGIQMFGVGCYDEQQINCWHFDCDSELILVDTRLDLVGVNKITGFAASSMSRIYGFDISPSPLTQLHVAGGADQATLCISSIFLAHVELFLEDESNVTGIFLNFASKIICGTAHGNQHTIVGVQQQINPALGDPDAPIEILAGAVVTITGCTLSRASEALIKNACANGPSITNCRFIATGAVKTIKDVGAGDFTLGVGNKGVSSGGGLSLAANSKVTIGDYNFA